MKLFQELGAEIERRWLQVNYNEDALPAIAVEELGKADLPSKVSAWDVAEWAIKAHELTGQRDLTGTFGDPPLTVYSGLRCHIDVYFWFDGTTAIHQHGFCGAFQVLNGSSIHSWYEFEREEKVNTFCEIGRMSLRVCELLQVGDIQEIWGGKQYIHSLFHLDHPSATIVVRTDRSPLELPQLAYYKPRLVLDPFFEQSTTTKKLQVMAALIRADRPEADKLIGEWLDVSDVQTCFVILSDLRHRLRSNQLRQMFKPEEGTQRFHRFVERVRERHGRAGDAVKAAFEHMDMHDELVNRRAYVTQPEHRFFMALLLNAPDRERIFGLISQRFPDVDPVEKVLDWVFDLAATRVVGRETSNALGIPEFGDAEMDVLEALLRGDEPDLSRPEAAAADAKIRSSVIFRPLLA